MKTKTMSYEELRARREARERGEYVDKPDNILIRFWRFLRDIPAIFWW